MIETSIRGRRYTGMSDGEQVRRVIAFRNAKAECDANVQDLLTYWSVKLAERLVCAPGSARFRADAVLAEVLWRMSDTKGTP